MKKGKMEQINGNNLEPNKLYYIELDNDNFRELGAYSLKHYGRFVNYSGSKYDKYANFEDIVNISKINTLEEGSGKRLVNSKLWRFYKMKKTNIEINIINRILRYIIGDENFDYLMSSTSVSSSMSSSVSTSTSVSSTTSVSTSSVSTSSTSVTSVSTSMTTSMTSVST